MNAEEMRNQFYVHEPTFPDHLIDLLSARMTKMNAE